MKCLLSRSYMLRYRILIIINDDVIIYWHYFLNTLISGHGVFFRLNKASPCVVWWGGGNLLHDLFVSHIHVVKLVQSFFYHAIKLQFSRNASNTVHGLRHFTAFTDSKEEFWWSQFEKFCSWLGYVKLCYAIHAVVINFF